MSRWPPQAFSAIFVCQTQPRSGCSGSGNALRALRTTVIVRLFSFCFLGSQKVERSRTRTKSQFPPTGWLGGFWVSGQWESLTYLLIYLTAIKKLLRPQSFTSPARPPSRIVWDCGTFSQALSLISLKTHTQPKGTVVMKVTKARPALHFLAKGRCRTRSRSRF